MVMRVLVDDIRDPHQYGVDRTFRTAKSFLASEELSMIDVLFLDHDLGVGKTGYDVIVELVEQRQIYPSTVEIVSSNPVGIENIGRCLEHNGYYRLNNRTFSLQ